MKLDQHFRAGFSVSLKSESSGLGTLESRLRRAGASETKIRTFSIVPSGTDTSF
jgi:hypothetical protein